MRLLQRLCLILFAPTLLAAQGGPPERASDPTVAREVQKPHEKMDTQENQMAGQQQEIENNKTQLNGQPQLVSVDTDLPSPRLLDTVMRIPDAIPAAQPAPAPAAPPQEQPKESPLSFRIGGAEFTPGGFMDFTTIFRTTNTTNTGGTNFFSIPFNNQVQGHLTEMRLTAANSRISLKAHEKFGENDVTAYYEMDFLGNDAANVEVTSNSHTFRQRLYWLDLKRGKWEILGGQSWSWLTPNRVGVSPVPTDVFYSQNEDFNYQVGLTWTRAPQFRVVYHPNEKWALGVALENPQQFTGQGEVTFPAAFNAQLAVQFDAANNAGAPNLHPDIIPKIAYDTDFVGKHFHWEAAGLLTSVKIADLPVGGTAFVKHTKTGGGFETAANLEVVKNIRIVANGFWSDGGGRYIFGMGPAAVVRPNVAGTDVTPSLVHSGSGIVGFEAQVTPRTLFFGYYGGAYFQRNAFTDTTSTAPTKPFIGFGGTNSANNNNRAIQEPTFGWTETFWKTPQYGALQFISQYSYVTRSPWYVTAGAPKNAHLSMVWLDLRYVLP